MLRSPTRLKFKDCKTAQKLSVGSSRGHQLLPPKSEMLQTVNIVKYCRLICGGWSGCLQPSVSQLFLRVCETKDGCWLQLAVTVIGICLTDIRRLRWSTRSFTKLQSEGSGWIPSCACVKVSLCKISICPWYTSECVCDERLVRLPRSSPPPVQPCLPCYPRLYILSVCLLN